MKNINTYRPDHGVPELPIPVYEVEVQRNYPKIFLLASIVPLVSSVIIGIILLFGGLVHPRLIALSLAAFLVLAGNAGFVYLSDKATDRKEAKHALHGYRPKKSRVKLAAWILVPGIVIMLTGLFQSTVLGIWSGIMIFVGSGIVLTAFTFVNTAINGKREFGQRLGFAGVLMWLMFLPAVIAFFAFLTIGIGAIGMLFG